MLDGQKNGNQETCSADFETDLKKVFQACTVSTQPFLQCNFLQCNVPQTAIMRIQHADASITSCIQDCILGNVAICVELV